MQSKRTLIIVDQNFRLKCTMEVTSEIDDFGRRFYFDVWSVDDGWHFDCLLQLSLLVVNLYCCCVCMSTIKNQCRRKIDDNRSRSTWTKIVYSCQEENSSTRIINHKRESSSRTKIDERSRSDPAKRKKKEQEQQESAHVD